jgi:hypothetical protein
MTPPQPAINLPIGKTGLPYQDVISVKLVHRNPRHPFFRIMPYSIPNVRGSHSEISGT